MVLATREASMSKFTHTRREVTAAILTGVGATAIHNSAAASAAKGGSSIQRTIDLEARPSPLTIQTASTAVIVVDMQNDFGTKGGMFDRAGIDISGIQGVIPALKQVLTAARAASIPVIYLKMAFRPDLADAGAPDSPNWIKHKPLGAGTAMTAPDGSAGRILIRGTWNTEIVPELMPEPNDTIVYKSRFSGFYRTELDSILKAKGIKTLIVTGCTTSVCVESTVRDAMFRDYACVVLEDCTAEPIASNLPRTNHDASLLTIQILLGWVSNSAKFVQSLVT